MTLTTIIIHDISAGTYNSFTLRASQEEAWDVLGKHFNTRYEVLSSTTIIDGTLLIVKSHAPHCNPFAATVYDATNNPFINMPEGVDVAITDDIRRAFRG